MQINTLNNKVNNWAMELEAFNIRFEHVSSKANILADTLSHLVDIDPDARLDPENARWEFGYYVFESLPKLSSEDIIQICEILSGENVIRPDPDIQQPFITTAEVPTHFGPATHPASPRRQMYHINTDAGKWQTGPCSLQLTGRYTISMSH